MTAYSADNRPSRDELGSVHDNSPSIELVSFQQSVGDSYDRISSCSLYKRHHHPDPRYPRRLRHLPLLMISSFFSSLFSFQTIVRSALTVKAPEESSSLDVFPLLPHAPYVVRFTVSTVALILIVTIFLYRIQHVLKRYQERGLKVQII